MHSAQRLTYNDKDDDAQTLTMIMSVIRSVMRRLRNQWCQQDLLPGTELILKLPIRLVVHLFLFFLARRTIFGFPGCDGQTPVAP